MNINFLKRKNIKLLNLDRISFRWKKSVIKSFKKLNFCHKFNKNNSLDFDQKRYKFVVLGFFNEQSQESLHSLTKLFQKGKASLNLDYSKIKNGRYRNNLQQLNLCNYDSFLLLKTGLSQSNFCKKIIEFNNFKKGKKNNFLLRIYNILNFSARQLTIDVDYACVYRAHSAGMVRQGLKRLKTSSEPASCAPATMVNLSAACTRQLAARAPRTSLPHTALAHPSFSNEYGTKYQFTKNFSDLFFTKFQNKEIFRKQLFITFIIGQKPFNFLDRISLDIKTQSNVFNCYSLSKKAILKKQFTSFISKKFSPKNNSLRSLNCSRSLFGVARAPGNERSELLGLACDGPGSHFSRPREYKLPWLLCSLSSELAARRRWGGFAAVAALSPLGKRKRPSRNMSFFNEKTKYYLLKPDQLLKNIWFQNLEKSNQNTYFLQRPISFPFQWIQKGDLISDCSSSIKGELALGKNFLVAYMPWEGFNFEDAVLINDKVLSKFTSLHIEKYDLEIAESGFEKITNNIPDIPSKNLQNLDKNGVIKIGSWVTEGDILVGKIIQLSPTSFGPGQTSNLLTHEKLLYDIVVFGQKQVQERCLKVPQGVSGRVIRIAYTYGIYPNEKRSREVKTPRAQSKSRQFLSNRTNGINQWNAQNKLTKDISISLVKSLQYSYFIKKSFSNFCLCDSLRFCFLISSLEQKKRSFSLVNSLTIPGNFIPYSVRQDLDTALISIIFDREKTGRLRTPSGRAPPPQRAEPASARRQRRAASTRFTSPSKIKNLLKFKTIFRSVVSRWWKLYEYFLKNLYTFTEFKSFSVNCWSKLLSSSNSIRLFNLFAYRKINKVARRWAARGPGPKLAAARACAPPGGAPRARLPHTALAHPKLAAKAAKQPRGSSGGEPQARCLRSKGAACAPHTPASSQNLDFFKKGFRRNFFQKQIYYFLIPELQERWIRLFKDRYTKSSTFINRNKRSFRIVYEGAKTTFSRHKLGCASAVCGKRALGSIRTPQGLKRLKTKANLQSVPSPYFVVNPNYFFQKIATKDFFKSFDFQNNQIRKQSQTKLLKKRQAADQDRVSLRLQSSQGVRSLNTRRFDWRRNLNSIDFSSKNHYNFQQLNFKDALPSETVMHYKKPIEKRSFKKITIYIAEKRKLQVGDKISGRHGNKGIISQIFSNSDMPYLSNGHTLDVLLNPLGVPSRMNVGQILECLLGFTGKIFHTKFKVLCFDEIYGYESSRSFIYSKIFELCKKTRQKSLFSKKTPGKLNLFDGRDGQLFYQSVIVGSTYLMKLIHVVDEKIHARGTGPYSLITQQPLRGRAQHGGQRVGEMEVWALQGFGSAYTLQELLTVKSDDLNGRNQIMQTLLKNKPLRFGTPESLRVVLRELQCLCLDLQLSDI